ncbi:MAG TPA: hypothetical protein VFU63_01020, partial [Ktedonobacterales bacterium]|nr:hypothetical protein [Ktedonobacterales bacterium]
MPVGPATSSPARTASAHLRAGQPLYVRVLGAPVVVVGLPSRLRARLADLLRPFVVAKDDATASLDAPALTFSVAW